MQPGELGSSTTVKLPAHWAWPALSTGATRNNSGRSSDLHRRNSLRLLQYVHFDLPLLSLVDALVLTPSSLPSPAGVREDTHFFRGACSGCLGLPHHIVTSHRVDTSLFSPRSLLVRLANMIASHLRNGFPPFSSPGGRTGDLCHWRGGAPCSPAITAVSRGQDMAGYHCRPFPPFAHAHRPSGSTNAAAPSIQKGGQGNLGAHPRTVHAYAIPSQEQQGINNPISILAVRGGMVVASRSVEGPPKQRHHQQQSTSQVHGTRQNSSHPVAAMPVSPASAFGGDASGRNNPSAPAARAQPPPYHYGINHGAAPSLASQVHGETQYRCLSPGASGEVCGAGEGVAACSAGACSGGMCERKAGGSSRHTRRSAKRRSRGGGVWCCGFVF